MQAVCKSDKINVFLMDKLYLEKDKLALIIVLLDLGIAFFMYLTFLYLKAMQNITDVEINEAVVTAADYAVEIKTLPEDYANMKDLKAKMWHYIENILALETDIQLVNPQT